MNCAQLHKIGGRRLHVLVPAECGRGLTGDCRTPRRDVTVPEQVKAVAAGRLVRVVWGNALGGLTFEVGVNPDRRFVKWAPVESAIDLGAEAARLSWR
jgi:hypothetical protein